MPAPYAPVSLSNLKRVKNHHRTAAALMSRRVVESAFTVEQVLDPEAAAARFATARLAPWVDVERLPRDPIAVTTVDSWPMPEEGSYDLPASAADMEPTISIGELALGLGPGWAPEHDYWVCAQHPHYYSRQGFQHAHRTMFGNPAGASNHAVECASRASRALTGICEVSGALTDIHSLRVGKRCGCCSTPFRRSQHRALQRKMLAAVEAKERVLVAPGCGPSYSKFLVLGRYHTEEILVSVRARTPPSSRGGAGAGGALLAPP